VRWLNCYWIESPIMTDIPHHRRADFKAIRAHCLIVFTACLSRPRRRSVHFSRAASCWTGS